MLELLKSERPAMILLDIMMPDGDGRDAFEQMRLMPHICHIPVVMMSAGVFDTSRGPFTLRFLAKTFDLDHLPEVAIGTIGTAAE
jgi:CheY-like chemotaxis protein